MKKDLSIAGLLILIAVLSRLIPHGWNFTAMGAVAVASGLLFKNRLFPVLTVMLSLLISDAIIGFHNTMIAVYLGYMLMTFVRTKYVVASSFLGSVLFFLVSNFGVWFEGQLYPQTLDGLMVCYTMAIPFFRNELLSTLVLTPVVYYGFSYVGLRSSHKINVA